MEKEKEIEFFESSFVLSDGNVVTLKYPKDSSDAIEEKIDEAFRSGGEFFDGETDILFKGQRLDLLSFRNIVGRLGI